MTKATAVEPVELKVAPALAIEWDGSAGNEPGAIGRAMGEGFGVLQEFVAARALVPSGPPRAIYHTYGPAGTRFTLAIPIEARPRDKVTGHTVRIEEMGGGKALRFTHTGPYERLRDTYDAISGWLTAEGMMASEADWANFMPMWEEYAADPTTTRAEELVTHIYLPLR